MNRDIEAKDLRVGDEFARHWWRGLTVTKVRTVEEGEKSEVVISTPGNLDYTFRFDDVCQLTRRPWPKGRTDADWRGLIAHQAGHVAELGVHVSDEQLQGLRDLVDFWELGKPLPKAEDRGATNEEWWQSRLGPHNV